MLRTLVLDTTLLVPTISELLTPVVPILNTRFPLFQMAPPRTVTVLLVPPEVPIVALGVVGVVLVATNNKLFESNRIELVLLPTEPNEMEAADDGHLCRIGNGHGAL